LNLPPLTVPFPPLGSPEFLLTTRSCGIGAPLRPKTFPQPPFSLTFFWEAMPFVRRENRVSYFYRTLKMLSVYFSLPGDCERVNFEMKWLHPVITAEFLSFSFLLLPPSSPPPPASPSLITPICGGWFAPLSLHQFSRWTSFHQSALGWPRLPCARPSLEAVFPIKMFFCPPSLSHPGRSLVLTKAHLFLTQERFLPPAPAPAFFSITSLF